MDGVLLSSNQCPSPRHSNLSFLDGFWVLARSQQGGDIVSTTVYGPLERGEPLLISCREACSGIQESLGDL